jgi:ATP-dependent Clp protease ATP-binding subunit ClpA
VGEIASAIRLSRSGLRTPDKPIGSFLFSGPTGVGKTELAKQIAKVLGIEFLRCDMSEYSERHTVSRLIGAPPGYVGFDQGGLLTDAVRKNPHSVRVRDEIYKAHPDLYNNMLQVMDHATLTDNNGRTADFRNIMLILTTNAGSGKKSTEEVRGQMKIGGFGAPQEEDESVTTRRERYAIERMFPPEFRNRLDGWVSFGPLSREVILKVVDKEVGLLQKMLVEKKVGLKLTEGARGWLADKGYDPELGARPLARLVDQSLKKPLSEALLFDQVKPGGNAVAELKEDKSGLELTFVNAQA